MTETSCLVKPSEKWHKEYLSFYHEWINSGEPFVPWVIGKDPSNFPVMLQELDDFHASRSIDKGFVANSTYWLISEDQKVVGVVNIRHSLNENLLKRGGHIGYGIAPSQRKKGHATKILELALQNAKKLGIKKVLVTCDALNVASEKTIIKNGGKQDADFITEDGTIVKRYWISNG